MEQTLKRDVQKEVLAGQGRILLHDEVEDPPGQFTITPQWETVSPEDIRTPRVGSVAFLEAEAELFQDVFEMVVKEGYKVRMIVTRDRILTFSRWTMPALRL